MFPLMEGGQEQDPVEVCSLHLHHHCGLARDSRALCWGSSGRHYSEEQSSGLSEIACSLFLNFQ